MLFAKAIFLLISVAQLAYAHPDGADNSACGNMNPDHHPHTPQASAPPFTVTTSVSSVSPGQTVNVVITRTNTATALRGFMVEARSPAGAVIGQFLPTAGMRTINCAGSPVGGVATHANAEARASISLNWVPPPIGFVGNAVFHVTAVQDFSTFWLGLTSPPLAVNPSINLIY